MTTKYTNLTEVVDLCQIAESFTIIDIELSSIDKIYNALTDIGYFVAKIDDSFIFDQKDLLDALYKACNFPEYFGFNWSALEDCLSDFSWGRAPGYVLIYDNLHMLNTYDLYQFLDIVEGAGKLWSKHNASFKLLVVK